MLSTPSPRLYWIALPILAVLAWLGLRNQSDPTWIKTQELLRSPTLLVSEAVDSMQHLYAEVHGHPASSVQPGDSSAFRRVMFDYIPTMEWNKYADAVRYLKQNRYMVISGVTGVGSTTLSIRIARLFAHDPENLLEIRCAPHFDLEYHKKYIGRENEEGVFKPGLMLKFWDKCRQQPNKPFVAVIDNFDKINPETFFGPEIWEVLGDPTESTELGGRGVSVPENFYMISVTHLGPGSYIDLNEEHFKRIGRLYIIQPNSRELLAKMYKYARDYEAAPYLNKEDRSRLEALSDTARLLPYLFSFLKANEIVKKLYSDGYQLGQGSNVKYYYHPNDFPELKRTFINHVNAFHPARPMLPDDFKDIDYSIKHKGLQPRTNFFAQQIQFLQDTGYLVEITVVAATAMLTALVGWWVFRRREQLIRSYGDRVRDLVVSFENQTISAEHAAIKMEEIKREVDSLVLRRKLNYTEGLYFLAFIEDRVRRIEMAKNVSENFLELFNMFMEDNYLSESEYNKICQFLKAIQFKLPANVYAQFRDKVEEAYQAGAAAKN